MSQDWFARKLAERGATRPVAPPAATPPRAPGALPAHMAPYAPQPQPVGDYAQQGPEGTPAAPPAVPAGQPQFTTYDAATGAAVADDGHVAALYNAAIQTGGSRGVKEAASQCPECGGTMFARDRAENGMKLRMPAAPQCVDCGYPVVQSGSTGGALGHAKSSGPAQRARQLPAGHQVTVMDGSQAVTFAPPTGR